MKRHNIRRFFLAKLSALAIITICLLQSQVFAQGQAGYIVIFPSVGIAPGQSLRLTLFNPNGEPVRAQARLHHSGGILVALGDGSVRSGAFHSFDFKRNDIPLPGELGTGRLQLRASLYLPMTELRITDRFVVSMETISISDGTSNTVFVSEVYPSRAGGGAGNDIITDVGSPDILMGIAPGQKLRITVFNPGSSAATYVPSQVSLFEIHGYLLEDSPQLDVPPGEFRSFDFNRGALQLPGEPGTGRLQVRAKTVVNDANGARLSADDRIISDVVSFEVIDNNTGRTVTMSGQQCLVFFLGGTSSR